MISMIRPQEGGMIKSRNSGWSVPMVDVDDCRWRMKMPMMVQRDVGVIGRNKGGVPIVQDR